VNRRPVLFFLALMVIVAAVIVFYLKLANPSLDDRGSNETGAGSEHAYTKELAVKLFRENCAECHGTDGRGIMSNPALAGTRLNEAQITKIIQNGRGEMPAVEDLDENQMHQIAHFVKHLGE